MNLGATKVHHLNPAFWKAINALLHQIISFLWVFIISQFLLFYAHFHGAREEEKKIYATSKKRYRIYFAVAQRRCSCVPLAVWNGATHIPNNNNKQKTGEASTISDAVARALNIA